MGDRAEDILTSFALSDEDAKKYSVVIEKFNSHFIKRRNVIFDRAKFNSRSQQEGESVEDFIYIVSMLWPNTACTEIFTTKWYEIGL